MMTAFENIETTQNVEQIQGYFGSMAVGQGAIRLEIVPALEKSGLSPAEIADRFPAVATLDADWVHILNDMTPMIGAMSDNVANTRPSPVSTVPTFPLVLRASRRPGGRPGPCRWLQPAEAGIRRGVRGAGCRQCSFHQ